MLRASRIRAAQVAFVVAAAGVFAGLRPEARAQEASPEPSVDLFGLSGDQPRGQDERNPGGFDHNSTSGPTGLLWRAKRTYSGDRKEAILAALHWLADHQNEDGSWSPDTFADDAAETRTEGTYLNANDSESKGWRFTRQGVTGLALLAYLGAGYMHSDGEFKNNVKMGLRWLKDGQDTDGCYGPRDDHHYVYNHAIAALAMIEAYTMTGARTLKAPANRGIYFIVACQNIDEDRGRLGWRYGVKPGDSDTSVTGWMAFALHVAKTYAKLDVPASAFTGAQRHLDTMTGIKDGYPTTGYITKAGANSRLRTRQRFDTNSSMDAINIALRVLHDVELRDTRPIVSQSQRLTGTSELPTSTDIAKRDYYYWYWGSLAMRTVGERSWRTWRKPADKAVLATQRRDGDATFRAYGSWDTTSAWGIAGGRVYTTAINCLTLETPFRYHEPADDNSTDDDDGGGDESQGDGDADDGQDAEGDPPDRGNDRGDDDD